MSRSCDVNASLQQLYASVHARQGAGRDTHAILVCPTVTRAGLGAGGQFGGGGGFDVGVGPSVVVVEWMPKTMTTTVKDDVYAFIFGQKGLTAGIGVPVFRFLTGRVSVLQYSVCGYRTIQPIRT